MPPHHPTTPGNLIYGVEDRPPRLITLVLAFQHVIILAPRLLYPVVIVQGFDGGMALAQNMVVMSMIAGGIGSILQALRKGPIGAGVLDPSGCGAAYIYPSIQAGALGGCGQSSSSANIGLSLATAATSRRNGWAVGVLLITLAFVPALPFFLAHMPKPVAGAIMVYVAVFLVVTGIQIMTTRLLDARKIYVVGVSLVFGLSVDIVPQIYSDVHQWLQPMFSSSLSLATAVALILNLVFRLGVASRAELVVKELAEASSERIFRFMQRRGAAWGARADVIHRAASSLNEMLETLLCSDLARGPVQAAVSFDEFNLDIRISYPGELMAFPSLAPEAERMLEDRDCLPQMAGFLTITWADKVRSSEEQGRCCIDLHFDH